MIPQSTDILRRRKRLLLMVLLVAWSLAVVGGFAALAQYSARPGNAGTHHAHWPTASKLARSTTHATLVMFLHPHCPCSRASLEELSRILTRGSSRADTHVVFIRPEALAAPWERTDLWSTAAAMPGVNVSVDENAVEARRFGAATSGTTLVYDKTGRLLFHGGITSARGHAGDNSGQRAVISALLTGTANPCETPVFGCALFDDLPGANQEASAFPR